MGWIPRLTETFNQEVMGSLVKFWQQFTNFGTNSSFLKFIFESVIQPNSTGNLGLLKLK